MKLTDEQRAMVESNLPLVHIIMKDKCGKISNQDYMDIYQIGVVGLCKAAGYYKPEYNVKFTTFATRCVINEIYMFFRKQNRVKTFEVISLENTVFSNDNGDDISLSGIIMFFM